MGSMSAAPAPEPAPQPAQAYQAASPSRFISSLCISPGAGAAGH